MPSPWRRRWASLGRRCVPWLAVVFLLMTAIDLADQRRAPAVVAAVVAAAGVQGVALGQRRRHPVAVTALVALADAVVLVVAPASVLPVGTWLALGPLAVARPPRVSLAGLAAASAVSAISFTTQQAEDPVFAIVVGVAVWALGEAIRSSRDASRQEALRAVAEERAHLEREIHDVLAHSLSLMVVQAAAAGDVFEARPAAAKAALSTIEEHGREALAEIRRLLGPDPEHLGDGTSRAGLDDGDLRDGGRPPEPGGRHRADRAQDDRAPTPSLARLDQLADRLRHAGAELVIEQQGQARPLPVSVEVSAYRIIQEATTNSVRHGRASRLTVVLGYRSDGLSLSILDDGSVMAGGAVHRTAGGGRDAGSGRGLSGMRERARLLGGTLRAGPHATGGYEVEAWLPEVAPA